MRDLKSRLEALHRSVDVDTRLVADPLRFVHRYQTPEDRELAGLIAAMLAFGRVDLFLPVLAAIFDAMDEHGGPRAYLEAFDEPRARPLEPLNYRWTRGTDLILLFHGLRAVLVAHGGLEVLLGGFGTTRERLERAVEAVRAGVVGAARARGLDVPDFGSLPLGLRHLAPSPADGSACKRWNLWLRWMVRPDDGVDLGVYRVLGPRDLVVPLDTHVARVSRFLGLTRRPDASWRTAEEVTAALRVFDPDDPVRFDFALAHLGISGSCAGHRVADVCRACPLDDVCTA